jgi:hypothetical protein
VNDVRFAVAAPPVGSRIAIVIASDPMNTVTATKPIRI